VGRKVDDHYPIFGWRDRNGISELIGIAHSPEEALKKARDKALEYADDRISLEEDLRFINDPGKLVQIVNSQ